MIQKGSETYTCVYSQALHFEDFLRIFLDALRIILLIIELLKMNLTLERGSKLIQSRFKVILAFHEEKLSS